MRTLPVSVGGPGSIPQTCAPSLPGHPTPKIPGGDRRRGRGVHRLDSRSERLEPGLCERSLLTRRGEFRTSVLHKIQPTGPSRLFVSEKAQQSRFLCVGAVGALDKAEPPPNPLPHRTGKQPQPSASRILSPLPDQPSLLAIEHVQLGKIFAFQNQGPGNDVCPFSNIKAKFPMQNPRKSRPNKSMISPTNSKGLSLKLTVN